MYFEVDLSTVPPSVELREAGDFTSFSVRVGSSPHAWVAPEPIRSLAGGVAGQAEWNDGLETMITFARAHGWVGEDGAIRAHVTYEDQALPDR